MYSDLPARARRQIQFALAAGWLSSAGAGVSLFAPPPNPLEEVLGFWPSLGSGVVLVVAALCATYGVVFRRYRWEWAAGWIGASALVPYALVAWTLCVTVSGLYSTSAFLATSLLAFCASRALLCSAHAAKLREVHSAATAVLDAIGEGEEDDGAHPVGG